MNCGDLDQGVVLERLGSLGVEAFIPLCLSGDGEPEEALFPNHVLVRLDPDAEAEQVMSGLSGASIEMHGAGRPICVPLALAESLRQPSAHADTLRSELSALSAEYRLNEFLGAFVRYAQMDAGEWRASTRP